MIITAELNAQTIIILCDRCKYAFKVFKTGKVTCEMCGTKYIVTIKLEVGKVKDDYNC